MEIRLALSIKRLLTPKTLTGGGKSEIGIQIHTYAGMRIIYIMLN